MEYLAMSNTFQFTKTNNDKPSESDEKPNLWENADYLNIGYLLDHEPPPLDFVIPGLLAGTLGALVSPGGAGKSNYTLQIAAGIATGLDLCGFAEDEGWEPGEPQQVAFLTAEDPKEVLWHRLHALKKLIYKHVSGDRAAQALTDLGENLMIVPLVGLMPNLMDEAETSVLASYVWHCRLVVIDTLRRFHRLPEIDDGAMASVIATLEALGRRPDLEDHTPPSILYLHHVNKASGREGGSGADQTASRGSSVLVDNARFQLNMVTMSPKEAKDFGIDEDERRKYIRVVRAKANYSAPLPDIWYLREPGGMLSRIDAPNHEQPARRNASDIPIRNRYDDITSGNVPATVNNINGGTW